MNWNWRLFRRPLADTRLSLEGWIYLVILTFITTGAILRNVNLLVLMAGLLYCSLILNWRTSIHLLRSLRGKRTLPHRIHARQVVRVQWQINNASRSTPACNVLVEDQMVRADSQSSLDGARQALREPPPDGRDSWWQTLTRWIRSRRVRDLETTSKLVLDHVDGQHSRIGAWRISFPARGRYQVGPAAISTNYPLGLLRSKIRYPATEYCYVAPQLGKLSPVWEKRLQSLASGEESGSRRSGTDPENFYALRPWRSGDSQRTIHWRTTARVGQPIVRQFDQKHNRDFALVLDLWQPQNAIEAGVGAPASAKGQTNSVDNIELALSFTATILSRVGLDLLGRVALGVCGSETKVFNSRHQTDWVASALKTLALVKPSEDPQLVETLMRVSNVVSAGTPVFVVSNRVKPGNEILPVDGPADERKYGGHDSLEKKSLTAVAAGIRLKKSQQVLSAVRWLSVDDSEFSELFSLNADDVRLMMSEGSLANA